jgi:hypothetical protein
VFSGSGIKSEKHKIGSTINGDLIMKLKFRVFCVFVVVLLSAIGCSDDDPRDPDLVIYEG